MGCEILDIKCLFVSEIVGSVTLAIIIGVIFYFIIASKMKFGFDTTALFAVPVILIFGLAFGAFSVIYAFVTILAAIMLAWLYDTIKI